MNGYSPSFQKRHPLREHPYCCRHLVMWSLWWAFAVCGGYQVENYAMNLWATILGPHHDKSHVYNGAIFATGTVLSGEWVLLMSGYS